MATITKPIVISETTHQLLKVLSSIVHISVKDIIDRMVFEHIGEYYDEASVREQRRIDSNEQILTLLKNMNQGAQKPNPQKTNIDLPVTLQ